MTAQMSTPGDPALRQLAGEPDVDLRLRGPDMMSDPGDDILAEILWADSYPQEELANYMSQPVSAQAKVSDSYSTAPNVETYNALAHINTRETFVPVSDTPLTSDIMLTEVPQASDDAKDMLAQDMTHLLYSTTPNAETCNVEAYANEDGTGLCKVVYDSSRHNTYAMIASMTAQVRSAERLALCLCFIVP
jgi:hypothetical protein